MTQQVYKPQPITLGTCLRKLFEHPSVVLIGGNWKTGKTDFGLEIADRLLHMPFGDGTLITEVASNIKLGKEGDDPFPDSDKYKHIYDLVSLRQWLYDKQVRKLYILDEASEHMASRRSMTTKNVTFIQLVPEISKAHARLLIIGHQLLAIDKTFLDDTWCRGVFIKQGLKKAQLISSLLPRPVVFQNIPATRIPFDPYAIAPFTEKPEGKVFFKDADKQLLWDWSNGKSIHDLSVHPMQLNRMLRKYVRENLESDVHFSHT